MKRGLTLVELLLIITCTIIAFAILPSFSSVQEKSINRRCNYNLDHIGKYMKIYTMDFGHNVLYPPYEGEEFLVSLYHMELLQEPIVYLCPSTADTNDDGADLATVSGPGDADGPCSYAGRKNTNQSQYPGIFANTYTSATSPMIADDWSHSNPKKQNHQNGKIMFFLFMDGHCDFVRSLNASFAQDYSALFDPLTN